MQPVWAYCGLSNDKEPCLFGILPLVGECDKRKALADERGVWDTNQLGAEGGLSELLIYLNVAADTATSEAAIAAGDG